MRENRTYGSEGGEAKSLPYPYQSGMLRFRTSLRQTDPIPPPAACGEAETARARLT